MIPSIRIYIEPAELPVGAVHAQHHVLFDRKKTEDHSCDKIKIKVYPERNLWILRILEFLPTSMDINVESL